jgi:hypothetical protein
LGVRLFGPATSSRVCARIDAQRLGPQISGCGTQLFVAGLPTCCGCCQGSPRSRPMVGSSSDTTLTTVPGRNPNLARLETRSNRLGTMKTARHGIELGSHCITVPRPPRGLGSICPVLQPPGAPLAVSVPGRRPPALCPGV